MSRDATLSANRDAQIAPSALEQDANVVWSACMNIRHGNNYAAKLTDAGALTCYALYHENDRLRAMAAEARDSVGRTLCAGPGAA